MAKQRNPLITVRGTTYRRLPIRTHVVTQADDIVALCEKYSREARQAFAVYLAGLRPSMAARVLRGFRRLVSVQAS